VTDDVDVALSEIEEALKANPGDIVLLLLRAETLWQTGRTLQAERVCRQILTRQPRALKPRYLLGQILSADPERLAQGVDLLHDVQFDDQSGLVADRLFAGTNRGPRRMAEMVTLDLPPDLQLLRMGEVVSESEVGDEPAVDEIDESPVAVGLFLDTAAETTETERRSLDHADEPEPFEEAKTASAAVLTRRPRLLGITVRQNVIDRYGLDGFERLERRLKAVTRELALLGVGFDVAFADDAASMAAFNCGPTVSTSAADLRVAVQSLIRRQIQDDGTAPKGPDRAVLLIGGDDIVPFFRVPNPADDDDQAILTDVPYGASDGSCPLLPDHAVGRLPDGYSGNLSLLLRQLDNLVEARREPPIPTYGHGLIGAGRFALNAIGLGRSRSPALACVAADRTVIAGLVVSAVNPGGSVQACPPTDPAGFDLRWLGDHRCLFLDASGTSDGDCWFGQPERDSVKGIWKAPIAFNGDNLAEAHLRSPVVFSTAGYAARFAAGTAAGSLALRFLNEGAAVLVASSASTYGSSSPPLGGSDLLANLFWKHLHEGQPAGEALRLARRSFASLELERQGYLDGDDQKTLLEFGVYGDPLFRVFEGRSEDEVAPAALLVGAGDFLCKDSKANVEPTTLDRRLVRTAVEFIANQHPDLAAGSIRVQRRVACDGSCSEPGHQTETEGLPASGAGITFVSARGEVSTNSPSSPAIVRIARATLDDKGQVVKMVISR
jgi:hypothetical protein